MDKRKHYVLVIDTETTNTHVKENGDLDMSDVLMYDCGWQVADTHGEVYEQASYVNRDIFVNERDLMQSAYYANKIPQYIKDLQAGRRIMATTYEIRQAMLDCINRWEIKEVVAHNARFDVNALNVIQRYITKSKYRYWLPYDIEIWDTMKMAESVILKMPTYKAFCEKYNYFTSTGLPRKTAEILWRFISGNNNFNENHTGLEDVEIETQIMAYCFRQHKQMEKLLYEKTKEKRPSPTKMQNKIRKSMQENPVLKIGASIYEY